MLNFVEQYGGDIYSQNKEDFIIRECLKRMKIDRGLAVEYGANDGKFCSNIRYLLEKGWKGIMIEADKELYDKLKYNMKGLDCIPIHQAVTKENINYLLPSKIDVLSIDTDGINDYESWFAYEGKAKIVIIEINSSIEPMKTYLNEGASYKTMYMLGVSKGYFLLAHTGNLIFLQNEYKSLFPELDGLHPIIDYELFFNNKWLIKN